MQALEARAGKFTPVLPTDPNGNTAGGLIEAWKRHGGVFADVPWPNKKCFTRDGLHLPRLACEAKLPAWKKWLARTAEAAPGKKVNSACLFLAIWRAPESPCCHCSRLQVLLVVDSSLTSHDYVPCEEDVSVNQISVA